MLIKILTSILFVALPLNTAWAQEFSIVEAGELVVGEDAVSEVGRVTQNLAVRTLGQGEGMIRLSAEGQSNNEGSSLDW